MSKINSLGAKEYSNIIEWMDLNQWQMSLCWGEHLLDISNENNDKWERNWSYFIEQEYDVAPLKIFPWIYSNKTIKFVTYII